MDQTKIILSVLSGISFIIAIVIGVFASRLESPIAHIWAQFMGKPLVGKKPTKQPLIIWVSFLVLLCIGASSAAMTQFLEPPPIIVTPAPMVLGPDNEDLVIAANSVQACMEAHQLSKQKEITIVKDIPYEKVEKSPGGLYRTRMIAYCQWPPNSYSDTDGYIEIIIDEVKGPGLSEASGASYADRIYSNCEKLKLSYFFGKQFVSGHSSFEVSANSIVDVRGDNWDPEIMNENPDDYYFKGLTVLGFYTEDKEVVVIHNAAFELEDATCIP